MYVSVTMASLSSKLIHSLPQTHPSAFSITPCHTRTRFQRFPQLRSKKSSSQDFQDYAKPYRLLPASEVKLVPDAFYEKSLISFLPHGTESLYKVKIQTSNHFGSDITDLNSGVLLCLIDESGSSILQRLSAIENDIWLDEEVAHDVLRFQRGSVDEFVFKGPTLGKIIAVWIGLESGQWRLGGISLKVICCRPAHPSEVEQISKQYTCFQYNFDVDDIILGEESETSMMEFRPHSVTTLAGDNFTSLFENTRIPSSLNSSLISKEESMKEYTSLKLSLLFYDAMLILAGSSILSITTGNDATLPFLTGGTFGFLYLLLLQRSVDRLSSQDLASRENNTSSDLNFREIKSPIWSFLWLFLVAAILVKYASTKNAMQMQFTPKDIVVGMMGFLACKVSVVLASFRPLPFWFKRKQVT